MKFLPLTAISCIAAALVGGVAQASTKIDFSGLSNGATVTNQYSGVVFSLAGGPDSSGAPTIWTYGAGTGLANSNSSDYPTANILDVAFSSAVSDLSFTFSSYGLLAPTTYTAYDSHGDVLDSGDLQNAGIVPTDFFELFNVAGSGITDLKFNNNTGDSSWYYAVQEITYSNGVPEASTWAMMLVGFVGIAFAGYRASRRRVAAVEV